jgi:cytochrome c oxidase subunit 3
MDASPSSPSWLQHQFDTLEQQETADRLGFWIFLGAELFFFSALIGGYVVFRILYPDVFALGSRHLKLWLGGLNTLVLLTSSLCIALATLAIKLSERKKLRRLLWTTLALGVVFLCIKATEYGLEYSEGLVPLPSLFRSPGPQAASRLGELKLFFVFYFFLTGFHALHMIAGLGAVSWLLAKTRAPRQLGPSQSAVELVALYWHFVDIIWVVLYPLLYLLKA